MCATAPVRRSPTRVARVLVVGAGPVGLEAALALRAFAGRRAEVEILAPGPSFVVPVWATAQPFTGVPEAILPLAPLVERAGVRLRHGTLAGVDAEGRVVHTTEGEAIGYDRLVVATGARREPHLPPPAMTFGGPDDAPAFRRLVARVARGGRQGILTHLALVVPPGPGWPLPAYELALLTAHYLERRGCREAAEITVVTAEVEPLVALGPEAADAVRADLVRAGIAVWAGAVVRRWGLGQLALAPAGTIAADRVVALPALRGPALPGLPSDDLGFIPAGADGRVLGVPDVWVAGDAGPFPVKQGGVGCQQADRAAALIAVELGAPLPALPAERTVRARLLVGDGERYVLRPDGAPGRLSSMPLWRPAHKLAGRFLAPFLAGDMRVAELEEEGPPTPPVGPGATPGPDRTPAVRGSPGR